jgi:membrane protein DedA with SNARE-associated domain
MSFEGLIEQYGYWMVAAGTILEGSTTVISAAFLAHRGYLNVAAVGGVAGVSTFLECAVLYEVARRRGSALAHHADEKSPRIQRVVEWVARRGASLMVIARFLLGVRTAVTLACGAAGVPRGQFMLANLAGAILWTGVLVGLGYSSGQAFLLLVSDVKRHERTVFFGLAVTVLIVVAITSRGRDLRDLVRAVGRGWKQRPV